MGSGGFTGLASQKNKNKKFQTVLNSLSRNQSALRGLQEGVEFAISSQSNSK